MIYKLMEISQVRQFSDNGAIQFLKTKLNCVVLWRLPGCR